MCLFVSESDEVFGTLRMYGAAACCNSRVHGRNVVLWAPLLSNKHPALLLMVAAVGAPGTIPVPFRDALVLLLLVQRSQRAAHQHSHG
jgi:hypothetical protein